MRSAVVQPSRSVRRDACHTRGGASAEGALEPLPNMWKEERYPDFARLAVITCVYGQPARTVEVGLDKGGHLTKPTICQPWGCPYLLQVSPTPTASRMSLDTVRYPPIASTEEEEVRYDSKAPPSNTWVPSHAAAPHVQQHECHSPSTPSSPLPLHPSLLPAPPPFSVLLLSSPPSLPTPFVSPAPPSSSEPLQTSENLRICTYDTTRDH